MSEQFSKQTHSSETCLYLGDGSGDHDVDAVDLTQRLQARGQVDPVT